MFRFEELRIYKEAILFNNFTYELTNKFPKEEMFGITNQLRRSSVSITLNIAEGTSRKINDFKHFLDMARGSCYECVAILEISRNREYITLQQYNDGYQFCEKLSKMISKLKISI